MRKGPAPKPPAERFMRHVQKTDGCWLWTGAKQPNGYGVFGMNLRPARNVLAHRAAVILLKGQDIAPGMYVCHRCDRPACVNPDHLFIGTPSDNQQDRLRKGRLGPIRRSLTPAQVEAIRQSEEPAAALAERFSVHRQTVSNVRNGATYKFINPAAEAA